LGKTFVALALASEARRPLVVAPMSLRGMWLQAAVRAGVRITMWSAEALSRGETAQESRADGISSSWMKPIISEMPRLGDTVPLPASRPVYGYSCCPRHPSTIGPMT